jgi:hypothetical protein
VDELGTFAPELLQEAVAGKNAADPEMPAARALYRARLKRSPAILVTAKSAGQSATGLKRPRRRRAMEEIQGIAAR